MNRSSEAERRDRSDTNPKLDPAPNPIPKRSRMTRFRETNR